MGLLSDLSELMGHNNDQAKPPSKHTSPKHRPSQSNLNQTAFIDCLDIACQTDLDLYSLSAIFEDYQQLINKTFSDAATSTTVVTSSSGCTQTEFTNSNKSVQVETLSPPSVSVGCETITTDSRNTG